MKHPLSGWFKWDFGLAAVCIYVPVIAFANFDKDIVTVMYLSLRQAAITFLVTSTVVAWVLFQARNTSILMACVWGIVLPASIVALSSFIAHWYFTNEVRNILAPFCVSFGLNSVTLTLARSGKTTFREQLMYVLRGFQ